MLQDAHLDKVLETVQQHIEDELPQVIRDSADWCHMYHLSQTRAQLIEWIPFTGQEHVLEIGAECGALTGVLAKKCASVTALEIDAVKSQINQTRHADLTGSSQSSACGTQTDHVTYLTGTAEVLEKQQADGIRYDMIVMVGSLPLAELYMKHTNQAVDSHESREAEKDVNLCEAEAKDANAILRKNSEYDNEDAYRQLLRLARRLLTEDGVLILALPNKLGLKYFAGCREDYFGAPFTGVEDYYYHKGMRTFGKRELGMMLENAGFSDTKWYYPYPDYRFAQMIYSDDYLPKTGELHTNLCNFDQERYVFFDETKAYDTLIREGIFPEMANSFLVLARPAHGEDQQSDTKSENACPCTLPSYIKYSAERANQFAIRTEIFGESGGYTVQKSALNACGSKHVGSLIAKAEQLNECFKECKIKACTPDEFVYGRSLQEVMEELVIKNQMDELEALLQEYKKRILSAEMMPFEVTDAFSRVFGDVKLPGGLDALPVSDIDLIFSNLIMSQPHGSESLDNESKYAETDSNRSREEAYARNIDVEWTAIDYEWTFDFPIPVHFLLYRAFFFAHHQIMACPKLELPYLWAIAGISEEEIQVYEQMERNFQHYVTGGKLPERDMLGKIGKAMIPLAVMDEAYRRGLEEKNRKSGTLHEKHIFFRRNR